MTLASPQSRRGAAAPSLIGSAWRHRHLISLLASREVQARYRGSLFGMLWAIGVPLLTAFVFTFVFSEVLNQRWQGAGAERVDFPLMLFCSIVLFTFFAEVFGRAPGLMLENVSYVKRIRFPLETLVWSSTLSALFNLAVGLVAFFVFYVLREGVPPITALALPLILAPYALMMLGLGFWFSATGTYLRDLRIIAGPATTMVMFLGPVFYMLDSVPAPARHLMMLNPITIPIDEAKNALFYGVWPDPVILGGYCAVAIFVAGIGHAWFQHVRDGFADVL
jgi:lipopolysaccharide transport system permease protein